MTDLIVCLSSCLKPLRPTRVFGTYLYFAAERQRIFLRRLRADPGPWTEDSILRTYKFTNAYRAADRVSQYLIKHVIYSGSQDPKEIFFRTLLFKLFNRTETWRSLVEAVGEISSDAYSFDRYDKALTELMAMGKPIYSAAYIMPSGGGAYKRKHQMHLHLLEQMMRDELPRKLSGLSSMREVFQALRSWPTLGDFLAFQYTIDLNYSTVLDFPESEFVIAGPGARDGLRKCFSDFGGMTEEEVISMVTEAQDECFRLASIKFPTLWGRRLQRIDCQNLFCEVSKYARVAHPDVPGTSNRVRIKQRFEAQLDTLPQWYPPKWGLNSRLNEEPECIPAGTDSRHFGS